MNRRTVLSAAIVAIAMLLITSAASAGEYVYRRASTQVQTTTSHQHNTGWGALECGAAYVQNCCAPAPVRLAQAPIVLPRVAPVIVAAAPPPPPPPAPAHTVASGCAELFYPTGNRATSAIHLTKCAPSEIQVGAAFDYVITVTNITDQPLRNVILTDELATGFTLASVNPAATTQDDKAIRWALGNMPGRASVKVTVTGKANAAGKLNNCVIITYEQPVCLTIDATNPQLKIVKEAPADVLKCDPIPVKITVTNTGVGPARDVKIVDTLPEGLVTNDGQREVVAQVGVLGQGESKSFIINAKAQKTGKFVNTAVVTGRGELRDEASATTVVTQPVLAITKTGPQLRYLGRPITYTINVANKGDGVARDTVLEDAIPAGTQYVSATEGGQHNNGRVVWQLGALQPGDSKQVTVTVNGTRIGEVKNVAAARAYCAEAVDASAVTNIAGIPAILLEVIDIDDPIEKGGETVYEITATNQGSTNGTNIVIKCELEEQMQFVSGGGATEVTAAGRSISMAPLPSLAPKARAKWQVKVKALGTGDIRFHVKMTSDQLDREVAETESTHLYE